MTGSERHRETLAHPVTSDTGRDPLHLLQARAKQRARPNDFGNGKHDAPGGGSAGPAGGAPTASRPEELSKAVLTMTTAVAKLAQSLSDSKEASVLKWERKRPTIRMTSPEESMSELIGLENAFAETGAKSFSRRWAIFRPSLEGRAKECVEVELERRGLSAEDISGFNEEDYKALYTYLLAYMEKSVGLNAEKKAEIALAAMSAVHMRENSGPTGAEKFISDYKHAYLMELRAGLVEDSEVSTTKRLFELKQKMSAELRSFVKGLPEVEQPRTLEATYDAIRRWAEKERAFQATGGGGSSEGYGRRRKERQNELKQEQPNARSGNGNSGSSKDKEKPTAPLTEEHILNLMSQGVAQALAKAGVKGGKGQGKGKGQEAERPAPTRCSRCKGFHLPRLGVEQCPNRISLEAGTLKETLATGKPCSYWVHRNPDGTKRECCGEGHTWEDHKAALVKAYGKGKGKSKGKDKGKENADAACELKETEQDFAEELKARLATEYFSEMRESEVMSVMSPAPDPRGRLRLRIRSDLDASLSSSGSPPPRRPRTTTSPDNRRSEEPEQPDLTARVRLYDDVGRYPTLSEAETEEQTRSESSDEPSAMQRPSNSTAREPRRFLIIRDRIIRDREMVAELERLRAAQEVEEEELEPDEDAVPTTPPSTEEVLSESVASPTWSPACDRAPVENDSVASPSWSPYPVRSPDYTPVDEGSTTRVDEAEVQPKKVILPLLDPQPGELVEILDSESESYDGFSRPPGTQPSSSSETIGSTEESAHELDGNTELLLDLVRGRTVGAESINMMRERRTRGRASRSRDYTEFRQSLRQDILEEYMQQLDEEEAERENLPPRPARRRVGTPRRVPRMAATAQIPEEADGVTPALIESGTTAVILPSQELPVRTDFARHVLIIAGFLMDLIAIFEAMYELAKQVVTCEQKKCGRPCRMRLPGAPGDWPSICGQGCIRCASHRADLPHCCAHHSQHTEQESFMEKGVHQWYRIQDAATLVQRRCMATMQAWWGLRALFTAMATLMVFRFASGASTTTTPSYLPGLPEPVHVMHVLAPGYHKQATCYVGAVPVLATFDTGSFRNAIRPEFLVKLEAHQRKHPDLKLVTARQPCKPTDVCGVVGAVTASYHEVVGLTVKFEQTDGRSVEIKLLAVILKGMGTDLIIGCPALDLLGFASSKETVELRAHNIVLPTVLPRETEPIYKVGDSYKKRRAHVEKLALFPKLVKQIEDQREKMKTQQRWDQTSESWKAHVVEVSRPNFGGTDAQWEIWCSRILRPYADRFWDTGCAAPVIQGFEGDIVPKEGAVPSARRPFKLSAYDEARLEQRVMEFEDAGQLYRVSPEDAGEWSSPAFIVDKQGDLLGRLVTDYAGPNAQTEDHPGVPADASQVLHKAAGKSIHSTMDMVWGFSQIPITTRMQRILTICTSAGLYRWRYLPMGPKQGPGICQGFVDNSFGDLDPTSVFVDDFHTGSGTFEEHVDDMEQLLQRGRQYGVQWRITKCVWCQSEVTLIGFRVSAEGRKPDPAKVEALRTWPKEESLADLNSMFHFANYLREFIPDFHRLAAPLKAYRAKGAKWEAYVADEEAVKAAQGLRHSVAVHTPLTNPDFRAAADYVATGRPFLLFVDASDFGYSGVLAQPEGVHGTPRPIAVLSKSFDETQQRWTPMERELHALYEAAIWSQKYAKSFRLFLLTDHANNTFRAKVTPSRRISKKLLRIAIELEPLGIERLYLAGDQNVLGDAPSRAPADRAVARNLPIPLGPIRDLIKKMFWEPKELSGDIAGRIKDLRITNPGVLTYLPQEYVTPSVPTEEDDELSEIPKAMERVQVLNSIKDMASSISGLDNYVPVHSTNFRAGPWSILMMPLSDVHVDIPDVFRTAIRVTRHKTKVDDVWVAHFPAELPQTAHLPGYGAVKAGATTLRYKSGEHPGQAEILAKRHLKPTASDMPTATSSEEVGGAFTAPTGEGAASSSTDYPAAAPTATTPHEAEGRKGPQVVLIDCFGGISASRAGLEAAKATVVSHFYIEIHEPAIRVVEKRFDGINMKGDIRALASQPQEFAQTVWKAARELKATSVVWSAGFPCRELSRVNQARRGLRAGETARFEEAKILYQAVYKEQKSDDAQLVAIWECVQSMTLDAANSITRELQAIDDQVEVVGIDTVGVSWCRRPRFWWTNYHVCPLEGEQEDRRHGLRHLIVYSPLDPLENILEEDFAPRWIGNPIRRFHTFTRCRPSTTEPALPTGKETATPGALERWRNDAYRYSPYQYEENLLLWSQGGKGDQWRHLNANERLQMLNFPKGYLEGVRLTEDERCALAGDPFSVKVFCRLLHAAGLGIWPPHRLIMINGELETRELDESKDEMPQEQVQVGETRGEITFMGREELKDMPVMRLRTAMLKADLEAGPFGLIVDSDQVKLRGYGTLRKLMGAINELPFLKNERVDGVQVVQASVTELPAKVSTIFIWTIGGRAALQWGGGHLRLQGSVTKIHVTTSRVTIHRYDQATVMFAYILDVRKTKAVMQEAARAGLYAYQPEVDHKPKVQAVPTLRSDAIDVDRWAIRARQEEDEDLLPIIILLEQGEAAMRRKTDRRNADLAVRHQAEFAVIDGLLGRHVHLPGGADRIVPVIPAGGNRAIVQSGRRHVLSWRAWVLHHAHNTAAGGHIGASAMVNKILTVGWWPNLQADCDSWVARCLTCRATKGQVIGSATWRSERYTSPFRVIQVDLITDLRPESDGNVHIVSAIDVFSLWLWLIPIPDKAARTVATALLRHVYLDLAGFPVLLRSDNGREFTAELTRELNEQLGTVQVFGSAYHPRSQALVEGSHKPTEAVLQAFVQERPETWAQQLPIARWAWNTTEKRSLNGMSPYQVVTGLVPRNPLASRLQRGTSSEWVSPVEYVNDLKKAMEDIYEEVKQAQERRAEETTARGEQGRIPRQLEVGEHVLLRRPPAMIRDDEHQEVRVSAKLQTKARLEIFKVIKRVGESNYVLGDIATGIEVSNIAQPVHADRLVPIGVQELVDPIEERNRVILEGVYSGNIEQQAIDGRVMVKLANRSQEETFQKEFRKLGVVLNHPRGIWADLSVHDHYFE